MSWCAAFTQYEAVAISGNTILVMAYLKRETNSCEVEVGSG